MDARSSSAFLGNADSEKEALDEEEMPTGRELEKLTAKKERKAAREEAKKNVERDITVGEIVDILEETTAEPKEEAVQMELDLDAEEHDCQGDRKRCGFRYFGRGYSD